jgi:hypothetical protein
MRTQLFEQSPPLDLVHAEDTRERWFADEQLMSQAAGGVGQVNPTSNERTRLLSHPEMQQPYTLVRLQSGLLEATADFRAAACSVVDQDLERAGLSDRKKEVKVFAGFYVQEEHGVGWHSDDNGEALVRYTCAQGISSMLSAHGEISRGDIERNGPDRGKLRIGVGQGQRLQAVAFPIGRVLRFLPSTDIHSDPYGDGTRGLVQITIY